MDRDALSHPVVQDGYQTLLFTTGTGKSLIEVIPSLGGAINRLQFQNTSKSTGVNTPESIVSSITQEEYAAGNPAYKGVLLFPFVNRLEDGKYTYAGKSYQFEVNEAGLNNSLHGFLFNSQASVSAAHPAQNEARITVQFSYLGEIPAYPFPMEITIEYRLHDIEGLTVTFNIINRHSSPVPLAVGWHPYFNLRGDMANWRMQLPTVRHISVDKRLLPTGHKYEYGHFKKLSAIDDVQLDHCFQIDPNNEMPAATCSSYLWSEEYQYGLDVWQQVGSHAFNYLQVCIPPARDAIAIEPVSANINAFNSGEGLTHLEPNKVFTQKCGVRLITSKPN